MKKYKFDRISFVSNPSPIQRSNQIVPIGRQRNYRNKINRWLLKKNELPLYTSSLAINHIESSLYSQHRRIYEIYQQVNFNMKQNDYFIQRTRHLEFSSMLTRFWLTIVSLTVLLIAIYLLMILSKISTIATTTTMRTENITVSTIFTTTTTTGATTKASYYCSGVSPYTLWQLYLIYGITMDIDTSQCSFNSTPLYFISLAGEGVHYGVGGYTAIYTPTNDSFTIFAAPLLTSYTNTMMLSDSQFYHWNVNWLGVLE